VRRAQIFAVIRMFVGKYKISAMCDFYNVSRRGYYDYVNRRETGNPDLRLVELIMECHSKHKRRYGYRRFKVIFA
jgi:hypothetical protein